MTTQDFTTTQTAPSQISWIQQLRKKIAAPIDNAPTAEQTGQQSTLPGSTLTSEAKVNTRRSELAPPPTIIEIQTLKAFSDRADEYEPADLALIDLIPADLALLNISPAQPVAPSAKAVRTL